MISYTHLYKQTKKICPLVTSVSFVVLVGLPQWLQRYMWLQLVLDVYTHLRKWLASLPHTDSLLYHFNTERIFQVCPPEFRFVWWMLKGKASVHPEESPEVSLPKCVAVRVTWKCKAVVQRPGAASRWAVLSLNPLPCCAQPLLLLYLQMDLWKERTFLKLRSSKIHFHHVNSFIHTKLIIWLIRRLQKSRAVWNVLFF